MLPAPGRLAPPRRRRPARRAPSTAAPQVPAEPPRTPASTPGPGAPGAPPPAPPPVPAKPDLAILAATTVADPGCGPREPTVTVRVTLKNVGQAPFGAAPRPAALLEATAKVAPRTTLDGPEGRAPAPARGRAVELEVVARDRSPAPDAGGALDPPSPS